MNDETARAHLSREPDQQPVPVEDWADEDESCPRCHRVNWGMTPHGDPECVSCGYVERAR